MCEARLAINVGRGDNISRTIVGDAERKLAAIREQLEALPAPQTGWSPERERMERSALDIVAAAENRELQRRHPCDR